MSYLIGFVAARAFDTTCVCLNLYGERGDDIVGMSRVSILLCVQEDRMCYERIRFISIVISQ